VSSGVGRVVVDYPNDCSVSSSVTLFEREDEETSNPRHFGKYGTRSMTQQPALNVQYSCSLLKDAVTVLHL